MQGATSYSEWMRCAQDYDKINGHMAWRNDENSPIYGMPIINVDQARTVFVLKRSMGSGFSGVDNPLFFGDNTRMLFGDAKQSIAAVVAEFKG